MLNVDGLSNDESCHMVDGLVMKCSSGRRHKMLMKWMNIFNITE
jgi:hypothetical protein